MKKLLVFLFAIATHISFAQVNGGEQIFQFLRLSQNPHITALGGISIINPSNDVMMSTGNPALLRPSFHTQLGFNYSFYYAKTKISNVYYAHYNPKIKTTFGVGLQYLNYGNFQLTDPIGNITNTSQATDYALSFSASKQYLERWRYGATIKLANSHLIDKKASALLVDLGVAYADTTNKIYVGAVIKNAGTTIRNYEKGFSQPLPLDLQIGFMKKFKKAPFSISILAHHLTKWDIRYDNPADKINNQLLFSDSSTDTKTNTYFADKLFRHFIFALDINLGKRLEISAGYNHLRRSELSIADKKGMSGFSMGVGMYLNKFTVHYAQSYYHLAGSYHELGLSIRMNQLFGLGSNWTKINWSEKYGNSF